MSMTSGGTPAYQGAGTPVISRHFVRNHGQLVNKTLADLADYYGISNGMMRNALRMARESLARRGEVLVVPTRAEGFVIMVTTDELTFLRGVLSRLAPINTELARYQGDHRVVTNSSTSAILDPLVMALGDALDAVADLLLA